MVSRYNSALHRFTIFFSVCVFFLIVAGALVTSNNAGLAVPDWPTSFGSLYKIPPMVGGIKYEHGHRMLAEFVGFLTIVFAVWTQMKDSRPWMKKLGWFALVLVIVQGIFGGLTVKHLLPWYVSTTHGLVAQTFFALSMLLVIFNRRRWAEHEVTPIPQRKSFDLRQLSWVAVAVIYMQLFFGAAFRHSADWKIKNGDPFVFPFQLHVYGAILATVILFYVCIRAISAYNQIKPVRGMGIAILALLLIQLSLGITSYFVRVLHGHEVSSPTVAMVAVTVAHVVVGALLLAHCFMLAIQARRYLAPAAALVSPQKVVTA
jgi:cytochrome c oxidase assembly protein subunit 15